MAALVVSQPAVAIFVTKEWWNKFLKLLIQAGNFSMGVDPFINSLNFFCQSGDFDFREVKVISIKERLKLELSGVERLVTREVVEYLDELGYRPATLFELLWWWLMNPQKRKNSVVVALGSENEDLFPRVIGEGGEVIGAVGPKLDYTEGRFGWDTESFAAVRKVI
jgi:hypothetical protein